MRLNAVKIDAIVCGGGFTGLYAAKQLALQGLETILITDRLGGLIASFEAESGKGTSNFIFDFGGHVYTTKDPELTRIMEKAGAQRHTRSAFYDGANYGLVPYPVQDVADKLRIIIQGETQEYHGQTLEDFAIKTFGKEFYEKWFRPFNKRIWTADPSQMDSDWVAGRIKTPGEHKEGWGANSEFYYAPGKSIINVMMNEAAEADAEVFIGNILKVDIRERIVIANIHGSIVEFKAKLLVLWTLPIGHLMPHLGLSLERFINNRVKTVGIGLGGKVEMDFDWIYGNLSSSVHRTTLLSRYHPSMAPEGCDSLLMEIPYRPGAYELLPSLEPPYRALIPKSLTLSEYANKIMDESKLSFLSAEIKFYVLAIGIGDCMGYPIPLLGLRKDVANAKTQLSAFGIMTAGRWGSWGYFNLEHCMKDVDYAIEALGKSLSSSEIGRYAWSSHYYKPYA